MDVARDVIELFSVKDPARAQEIAAKLDQLNGERQEEERKILDAIKSRFEEETALGQAYCMVIDGDGWHRGVIGITATRVVERYGRPALVISRNGDEAHGSGRSIPAFHLLNALESCSDLFSRFGGHAHAVGFSLPSANLAGLRSRLDTYARARLTLADFEPSMKIDAEIPLDQVTPELFQSVCRLEPFGMGNPEPVFAAREVRLMAPPRVMKDKHVKLRVAASSRDGDWRKSVSFNALGWHMAERFQQAQIIPGDIFDIAFMLDHNEHPDFGGLELSLKDFQSGTVATKKEPAVQAQTT